MADGIYVAMSGAVARAQQLDAIADNLANANTPGFKSTQPAFQSFLLHPAAVATQADMRTGSGLATGNALHVMPEEGAFLQVQTEGGTAYTRDGRLTVENGHLLAAGKPLLDAYGTPLSIPDHAQVAIDPDGRVLANGQLVGELALFRLEGPVQRLGGSLYAPGEGGRANATEVSVRTGVLESSNASALDGAIQMVSAQRHFDTAMQAIQTYRRLDERAVEVGRVR